MTKAPDKEKGKILNFKRDPDLFAKLGDLKRAKNDPVSAVSRYLEALSLDPYDWDTRLAAAEVLTDMTLFNDSNKLLIPYMQEDEAFRCEAYCIVGFNLLGLNEPEGARGCFNRFFDMTDEVSERTDAMLDALDYIDSLEEEVPLLRSADEKELSEKYDRANEAFEKGDYEGSAAILRELVEERPDDQRILYDLALSCICSFKGDESEIYIDRLLEINENNWPAWSLKLMYAKGKKNELEVKKICKKLAECDSELPDELFRVNGSLLEAGCADLALSFGKKLVRLLPYDRLANHRLALSYSKLGNYKAAADIYEKLLRIDREDFIAAHYRNLCLSLDGMNEPCPEHEFSMLQYQLPFDKVIDVVKELLSGNRFSESSVSDAWRNDPKLKRTVRWAFSLHEFNINYAMLNLLLAVGDKDAETLVREVIADIDAGRSLVNEGLGVLKKLGAAEPYFAMLNGTLIEGRVKLVDLSKIRIPKQYADIFPRFRDCAKDLYPEGVISTGGRIAERFITNSKDDFGQLSKEQSEALSAAVEYLACDQSGVAVRDDVLERYGVTKKRLLNAMDRIVSKLLTGMEDG